MIDSLNTKVIDLFKPPGARGEQNIVYLTTSDNHKYALEVEFNESFLSSPIKDRINLGDSIKKKNGSDTLTIEKSGGEKLEYKMIFKK